MSRTVIGLVAASSLWLTAACGGGSTKSPETETGPIIIGAPVAESGFMTAYDGAPFQALELAVKEINAKGGVDGRKIQIVSSDTGSDRANGKAAAEDVIGKGAQIVVASCDYDYGSPAALASTQAGLLTLSLCAQSLKWGVQGISPLAFTPANATVTEGAVAAEWAESKGWAKAFVLNDPTTSYDTETCDSFTERFKAKGGQIVGSDTFKNGDASIASQIAAIKSASPQPDFIRLCSYVPGVATALRQIRAAGITLPIVGNAADDGSYWLKSVPDLSDFFYPAHASIYGDDPSPQVNEFVKNFTSAYGAPPATSYALFGYANGQLIADAIKEAGSTDGAALTKVLEGWKDHDLIVGPTSYTDEVHIPLDRPMAIVEVQGGKPKFLEQVQLSTPPAFKLG